MENIEIDFSNCKSVSDIHELLSDRLEFPEWYGKNLDALHDLLTERQGFKARLIGCENVPRDLLPYMEKVVNVFDSDFCLLTKRNKI
ncbi:hypothetical protein FACS1894188_04070 [Clostridia bacterium]|nr:hypothetical protein FACS1894188_04070 [Clostridia bacterium]